MDGEGSPRTDDQEGNPPDKDAPDLSPRPEPPPPPLDEPASEAPANDEQRLSKQVPLGLLFIAATIAVLGFLAIVGVLGYFALKPEP